MKHFIYSVIIIGIVATLTACETKPTQPSRNYTFNKELNLTAEKIKIDQIIDPADISKSGNYIIIQSRVSDGSKYFYVYTRDDFKFLYNFGRNGRGPDEMLFPIVVQHAPENMFLVYDNIINQYFAYQLTDKEAILIKQLPITIKDRNKGLMQSVAHVNDSIILFNTLSGIGNFLHSMNINTSQEIDVITLKSEFKERMGDDYNPSLDGYHIDYKDGLVVLAYNHVDEMVFTAIDSNYRFIEHDIELKNTNFTPKNKLSDNFFYYLWPYIGDEFVFTQRYGKSMQELQPFQLRRNFSFDVEVLNKQNEPVALLHFDRNMWHPLIDEVNRCIYAWDPRENFDYIDKYTFDL